MDTDLFRPWRSPWVACRAFLLLLAWPVAALAQVSTPLLEVHGAEDGVSLAVVSQVLEDPSGTLDLPQVRIRTVGWQPGPSGALVFGYSQSTWWVHTRLVNASGGKLDLVVDLGSPRQDHVHWFVLRDGGARIDEALTGDRLPFSHRPVATRNFVLPLALAPLEEVEIYTRLASHDGLYEAMPLQLYGEVAFERAAVHENTLLSLFHGALISLALYNLLLFVATRERAFGLYVVYLGSFIAWSLIFRGYAFQYLWPNATAFNNNILTVASAGIFACIGLFAVEYLRLGELPQPWIARVVRWLIGLNVLVAVPALAGYYALGAIFGWIAGIPLAVVTLALAVWQLWRGSRPARFYVAAFTLLAVGGGAYILQIVQVLPANVFTTWGIVIGSIFEVLLLALGLADSMNTLKAQKLAAERREREAQLTLNTELEEQVRARTEALERANRQLGELAITDALTGAFNRRHFNDFCAAFLSSRQRGEGLAFCMLDIDHFKAYNDLYGHQAGDEVLRSVAESLQSELKRSDDILFRLGGEEFGVLFTCTSSEMAVQFVERLRLAVCGLQHPHAGSLQGIVTASFGLTWWGGDSGRGLAPERMYAQTDRLLYAAKAAGRNRVAVDAMR